MCRAADPLCSRDASSRELRRPLGDQLTLIQLGETFNATVVLGLSQDAPASPRAIRLHVELQAPSGTRGVLLERKADALAEDQALESQITHEVKEIGLHALVCSIAYQAGPDDQADRQLRKLYRFTATSPCSVKVRKASQWT